MGWGSDPGAPAGSGWRAWCGEATEPAGGWSRVSATTTRPDTAGTRRPLQTTWMSDPASAIRVGCLFEFLDDVIRAERESVGVQDSPARTASPGSLVVAVFRYWVSGSLTGRSQPRVCRDAIQSDLVNRDLARGNVAVLEGAGGPPAVGDRHFGRVRVLPPVGRPQMTLSKRQRPARLSGRCSSIRYLPGEASAGSAYRHPSPPPARSPSGPLADVLANRQ